MKPESLEETIRRYRSQLLQYQSRSAPPAERLPAAASALAPDPELPAPAPEPTPAPSPDGVGTLVAAVTTAREALPVAGADVMLSRRDAQGTHLLYFLETDRSGRTPVMQLPAPAASQSESPGSAAPYADPSQFPPFHVSAEAYEQCIINLCGNCEISPVGRKKFGRRAYT